MHIIKMYQRLTDDEAGVYFSCEESGRVLYVSDLKKNGTFHYSPAQGALMVNHDIHLFHAVTQNRLVSFDADPHYGMYTGMFYDVNNNACGRVGAIGSGKDRYYSANIYGNVYECYMWTVGTAPCMMIYKNGYQTAMLVEEKLVINNMYSMTLHIMDDSEVPLMCLLGLVYHQFENVHNMKSRFHMQFIKNGYAVKGYASETNYHFEVPIFGVGKAKYDINFLRQFYPNGYFPYDDSRPTVGSVMQEMKQGMRESVGIEFSEQNLKKQIFNPLAIAVLAGVGLVMCVIGGFVGPIMLNDFGFDIMQYSQGIRFLIGFLIFFLIIAVGYGFFFLMIFLISKKFGNKQ